MGKGVVLCFQWGGVEGEERERMEGCSVCSLGRDGHGGSVYLIFMYVCS